MQCLFLEEWFFVEPLLKERAVVEREVLVSWPAHALHKKCSKLQSFVPYMTYKVTGIASLAIPSITMRKAKYKNRKRNVTTGRKDYDGPRVTRLSFRYKNPE